MYNVSANFHNLAIADSPKTRCRIYFIDDTVNCWDDNDVQTNGTLLVGAVGDTDSNGRIGQGGVTVTEIYNKEKNLTLGGTVSYQIGMTLMNADGALNNFAFGRCKVYLDVYDDANSAWLPCPLGVFRIELPVKRKVQLITATGYDQMQALNAIADTWWNGLDFTGGLAIVNILNSMVTELGLHLSTSSFNRMLNQSISFTSAPFDSVERTYRDILGWIAEATGTVARFNRNGELYLAEFLSINKTINTDSIGNQCLSIDIAEYTTKRVDALTIKLTNADQGVTVGSGTNVYTIMDNPFLYGPDVAAIQSKITPIYNRLYTSTTYTSFKPISIRLIYDWSFEAGDIIIIKRDSVQYTMPIFQQTMTWRGGYVTAELISSGDPVRPQVSSSERETYRYNKEMATKVGDNEIISKINQTAEQITIQANRLNLLGYTTINNGFVVNMDGTFEANGAEINGSLTSVGQYLTTEIDNGQISITDTGSGDEYVNIGESLGGGQVSVDAPGYGKTLIGGGEIVVLNENGATASQILKTGAISGTSLSLSGNQIKYMHVSTHNETATSVSANSQGSCNIDIEESGHTPIGIVAVNGSNNSGLVLIQFNIVDSQTARLVYWNMGTVSRTPTWYINVLYQSV